MKVLIKQAQVNDPQSPFNGNRVDIFINQGLISDIHTNINADADLVIGGQQLAVSPGWLDVFAHFGDPGQEYKETLETGADAAAAGGFTDVMVMPNTQPVIDSKTQVQYLRHKSTILPVTIHPIGAISRHTDGKELAEMYDMRQSGALAFSDGLHPVQSAGLLVKALQYVKAFEGVVIQLPDDKSLGASGLMHEGVISTRLGLSGKPMMAEELLVARDIKLVRYTDSALHFTGVTSPKSLNYIRRAKESGLRVTCSVTPYHLFFTDDQLWQYDTNLKVYPPLRTASERTLLREAILDGTIDCIATHHLPHETDSKIVEFEAAAFGMIGLETCYAALKTAMPEVPESKWVELLSINPRKIFGLPVPQIQKDKPAIVTIYEPGTPIIADHAFFRSRSRNSAFMSQELTGKVIGIVNQNKNYLKN